MDAHSEIDDEMIIEEVRLHECLYNKKFPTYRDKASKENAWRFVAGALNTSVDSCQKKWKVITDRYRAEVKKAKENTRPGFGTKYWRRWEMMPYLDFLRPQPAVHRRTSSNLDFLPQPPKSNPSTSGLQPAAGPSAPAPLTPSSSRKRKPSDDQTLTEIMKTAKTIRQPVARDQGSESNAEMLFLLSMHGMLMTLSPRKRMEFKARTSQLVAQLMKEDSEEKSKSSVTNKAV